MTLSCKASKEMGFIIHLIHTVHRIERMADRCFFAPHGLSMSTGQILMCLYHANESSPTELTEAIGGKKSNMTQRIALLKKAGLVELNTAELGDKRRIAITLTDKGKELAQKMEEIFETHIREFENGMTDEQKETVTSVLGHMNKKMDLIGN